MKNTLLFTLLLIGGYAKAQNQPVETHLGIALAPQGTVNINLDLARDNPRDTTHQESHRIKGIAAEYPAYAFAQISKTGGDERLACGIFYKITTDPARNSAGIWVEYSVLKKIEPTLYLRYEKHTFADGDDFGAGFRIKVDKNIAAFTEFSSAYYGGMEWETQIRFGVLLHKTWRIKRH